MTVWHLNNPTTFTRTIICRKTAKIDTFNDGNNKDLQYLLRTDIWWHPIPPPLPLPKLYIPSTLNTDYPLWLTQLIVCSKVLNHGLNHWLLFSIFNFFLVKNILNWFENSGLKSRILFCLIFHFYLMYRLIFQKPAHFLSTQMALVSTFFQMFIVLGVYNFGVCTYLPLACCTV